MIHYVNVSVLIKFSQKTSVFTLIIIVKKRNEKSYQVQAFCEERGLTPFLGVIW